MQIAVIGLGKIGLPLAVQYAAQGHHVVGVDVDTRTVAHVNDGHEPFPGEQDLAAHLAELAPTSRLVATTDYSRAVPESDVVVVVVPLVVDEQARPDFTILDSATSDIASHLTSETLVVYETTLPVGTTRERWRPALEAGSGLREGVDFHLAFSPERVLTGRVFADLRKYPKLVGALSAEGSRRAREFYESVLDFDARPDLVRANGVWDLGSPEAAELTKLAETTYRDVNIGLANQFARFADAHGIDVHAVIAAANSQPYSHIHRPGISVGGHCIPVYPRLYLHNDPDATIVRAAREANAAMPGYAVDLLAAAVGGLRGARVAVLGATYRPGVKETAFTGATSVVESLTDHGAAALVHDPLLTDEELGSMGLVAFHPGDPVDAAIVHTEHDLYRDLESFGLPGVRAVLDGRNVVERLPVGTTLVTLGRA